MDGGGNVAPVLGLCRRLVARGHSVRVLAPPSLATRVVAARGEFRMIPANVELDLPPGQAIEEHRELWEMAASPALAAAFMTEVAREPADVLVVDCLLDVFSAAESINRPTAVLLSTTYRHWIGDTPGDRLPITWERCARTLVVLPREFDDPDERQAANAVYVGPISEGDDEGVGWDLPWPPEHPDPLIVISYGTTYMHQEKVIERVLAALEGLRVRALLTLGHKLPPDSISAPPWVVVRPNVPHAIVMPHAALVVTHAGMGTVMAAFSYGVPLVCQPLGRDQPFNARRVEELGAGRTLSPDSSVESVRSALTDALGSPTLRAGARRMADVVASYQQGARAVAELELLLKT